MSIRSLRCCLKARAYWPVQVAVQCYALWKTWWVVSNGSHYPNRLRKSYMTAWLRFKEFLPVDWKEAAPEDVVAWVQTLAETVMTSTV